MVLSPFSLALLPAALLTAVVGLIAWQRRSAPGARALALLAVAVTGWELTSALCIGVQPLEQKVLWAKVQYVFINAVPLLWVAFCAGYGRRSGWLRRLPALALLPAAIVALAATNERHHLVWSRITLVHDAWGVRAVFHHGPAFWLLVAYHYVLLVAGSAVLLRTIVRLPPEYERQGRFLLLGVAVPWVGNLLYVAGVSPLPGLDLTPFGFSLAVILMAWALSHLALLDLVPVARDVVVDRMTDGVLVLDLRGRVVDVNPAVRRWIDRPGPLVGLAAAEALPWPTLVARLAEGAEGTWELPAEETAPLHLEAQLVLLPDRRNRVAGWLVLVRDVSSRVEAVRLREELIALVSHELRTPLTAVQGALKLMGARDAAGTERLLEIARRNTQRLLALTTDLLNLERIKADPTALHARPEPLAGLLQAVVEEMQPAAAVAGCSLEREPASAWARLDRDRIHQVLVNLVGNAIKFSRPGDRITLGAREEPDGRHVRVTVRDTGPGIAADQLQRIFEPFEQVEPGEGHPGGSGLGLAISRAIVLRHAGRIWAESAPGEGSAFHFTLPSARPERERSGEEQEPEPTLSHH